MIEILLWIIAICAVFVTVVLIVGITYVYTAINRIKNLTKRAGSSIIISKVLRKLWRLRR